MQVGLGTMTSPFALLPLLSLCILIHPSLLRFLMLVCCTTPNMIPCVQTAFYFGYMAYISFVTFVSLGAVGFLASFLFVRYIYQHIKAD